MEGAPARNLSETGADLSGSFSPPAGAGAQRCARYPHPGQPRLLRYFLFPQNLQVPLSLQRRQLNIRHHPHRHIVQRQLAAHP
jgi:hypothetical protein